MTLNRGRGTEPVDLTTLLAVHNREQRNLAIGYAVGAVVGWAALYASAYWIGRFIAYLALDGGNDLSWLPHPAAAATVLSFALAIPFYLHDPDARHDDPEYTTWDQVAGHHGAAGEFLLLMLLIVPRLTAWSVLALRQRVELTEDERQIAEAIVTELHRRNDWLPAHRYASHARIVKKLLRAEILRFRARQDQPQIRLNPSVMP